MSILETVLENTNVETRGNRIVSQVHDVNAINFVAGLTDPGEMISCGYLPEARRLPGEQDAEYAERIRPLIMALPVEQRERIMSAAINRADYFVRNGRVSFAVAGEPAWAGLGVRVEKAMTDDEAIRFANLDIEVEKTMLRFAGVDGKICDSGVYGLRYVDSNELLHAPVTDRYQVIQNRQAFDFTGGLVGRFNARYEAAGSIDSGRKVFLLMHFPDQGFTLSGDDRTEAYILFTNTHGGEAAFCFPTNERVVCANTCRRALAGRKGKGISLRHTGNILNKIAEAQDACGLAVQGFQQYKEEAEVMFRTQLPNARQYFGLVLDDFLSFTDAENALRTGSNLEAILAMTEAEKKSAEKSLENKLKRQDLLLEQMIENYEQDAHNGTVWDGWNAVTKLSSHGKTDLKQSRNERRRLEKRFESLIDGDRDDLSQAGHRQAMTLVS